MDLIPVSVLGNMHFITKSCDLLSPVKERSFVLDYICISFVRAPLHFGHVEIALVLGGLVLFPSSWQCKSKGLRHGRGTAYDSCARPGMQGPTRSASLDQR